MGWPHLVLSHVCDVVAVLPGRVRRGPRRRRRRRRRSEAARVARWCCGPVHDAGQGLDTRTAAPGHRMSTCSMNRCSTRARCDPHWQALQNVTESFRNCHRNRVRCSRDRQQYILRNHGAFTSMLGCRSGVSRCAGCMHRRERSVTTPGCCVSRWCRHNCPRRIRVSRARTIRSVPGRACGADRRRSGRVWAHACQCGGDYRGSEQPEPAAAVRAAQANRSKRAGRTGRGCDQRTSVRAACGR